MRRNNNNQRPSQSAAADVSTSPSFTFGGATASPASAFAGTEVIAVSGSVVRLRPYQYVHVHNNNENVTRMLVGPLTYTRMDHEAFVSDPKTYVCVPPSHYCIIENPVVRNEAGEVVQYKSGQVKTQSGEKEVRFEQAPFPLYPGEVLAQEVSPLPVLQPLEAYHVAAVREYDDQGIVRKPGAEWLVYGPCVFRPSVALEVRKKLTAVAVSPTNGLVLRAVTDFTDRQNVVRRCGDEWLYATPGSFLPWVEEEVVRSVNTVVLTPEKSLHVRAIRDFKDRFGTRRLAGEQWLVTCEMASTFMPTPHEEITREVALTVVKRSQYCVVLNSVDADGKPRLGHKELRRGVVNFFLHPGEELQGGVSNEIVLGADEGLVLSADATFEDATGVHAAGDLWMIRGPATYIPPVEVTVRGNRKAIPLDKNEGVYIRDRVSGRVRAHIGSTVMLNENEELWDKELEPLVEELLTKPRYTNRRTDAPSPAGARQRVKHRVVSVNVPHNYFMQVYDFNAKKARVLRGPELVFLGPDEQFTVISMSAGTPKQSDLLKTLCLFCGPDYMTDSIIVETRDHARLKLDLSYNWEFDMSKPNAGELMFNVPDFVGDACKAIASRIRGAVASEPFDAMHLHSANIIRGAVFEDGNPRLEFSSNGLIITSVDIHSVDPVDAKTSEALTKAVQLAIEITTTAQEAAARHAALKLEQAAKGRLERQIILDKAETERATKGLLELNAINAAIEATGESTGEAKARAAAVQIEGQTEVSLAQKRVSAETITAEAELHVFKQRRELELGHREKMYKLDVDKLRGLAKIEAEKFQKVIAAIGRDTITAMASAGPEMQAKLLKGLGLQGYLVTDGSNPINLFNAARGMTNAAGARPATA